MNVTKKSGRTSTLRRGLALGALLCAALMANGYTLDWWTVDAGGAMWSTGAGLELSGTIGQADTGPALAGGGFELAGGFWPVAHVPSGLLGDLNCDGLLNVFDIDPFVLALTAPEQYALQFPTCDRMRADVNGDGLVNAFDIDPFVVLLTGG